MKNLNLQELRKKKGLLQKEVAKRCNISPGFYSLIENGKRKPSLETARNISSVLGVTLDEFYAGIVLTISDCYPEMGEEGEDELC